MGNRIVEFSTSRVYVIILNILYDHCPSVALNKPIADITVLSIYLRNSRCVDERCVVLLNCL